MRRWLSWICAGTVLLSNVNSARPVAAQTGIPRVQVPDGFQVTVFADDDLASNVYSLTVDALGRVVVAGPGYVRILHDRNGDGRAESFTQYADRPASGAQGLFFDGRDLLATGDGGLLRFRDRDGDDRADGQPERLLAIRAGGEHDAHAIRRGPDGWFYLLAGNNAGVTGKSATLATSPIREPQSGTLLRLSPEWRGTEILVDGFRNAYDFAFNASGDLFVFDSDGERDVSLPWYRATRVFHALAAARAGWVSRSWKRPGYFLDMPPVIGAFGRGSPTGVACYRHVAFPTRYRGAVFALDWTFGRVLALPLQARGASYRSEPIEFMTGRGHFGFAPTDVAVGSDGALYISVGGRGSRGSVYRVTHPAALAARPTPPDNELSACLQAPQPLASWSRRQWVPLARKLGRVRLQAAASDQDRPEAERVRAIEILVELFAGLDAGVISRLARDRSPAVRARTAWAIGRLHPAAPDSGLLSLFLIDRLPRVGRQACEALLGAGKTTGWRQLVPGLLVQLDSPDRYCRQAAAAAVARMTAADRALIERRAREIGPRAKLALALADHSSARKLDRPALEVALAILTSDSSLRLKLDAARLAQLALADVGPLAGRAAVFDGYGSPLPAAQISPVVKPVTDVVSALFPSGHRELDYELCRLASMVQAADGKLLQAFLDRLSKTSHPVDDLHFLIAASRLPLERTPRQRNQIAAGLVGLQAKIDRLKLNQDSNWDDRVGELFAALVGLDPQLPLSLLTQTDFGQPFHVLFVSRMPRELRPGARRAFVERARRDGARYAWNGDVVSLIGESNAAGELALVRSLFERFDVRSAVLLVLARAADPVDRKRLISGLDSSSLEVLKACLGALGRLPAGKQPLEQLALLRTLRRLGSDQREHALRTQAVALLRRNTGRKFGFVTGTGGRKPQADKIARWTKYLQERFPEDAGRQLGLAGIDLTGLRKRLAKVDWDLGDAGRGRGHFTRRGCHQCHGGRRALGPDLAGAAQRFAREDLFAAILLPNRDVSPRYQTTLVQTTDGKVYTGLVIYNSVDGLTMRTGTNQTVRIESSEIEVRARRPESLMPTGLLKGLGNADLADLYAYLRSLRR